MLVLDTTVVLAACAGPAGFERLGGDGQLVAPALMWSEFRSMLHESVWRSETSMGLADQILGAFGAAPIRRREHPRLGQEAWRVADELGWAKTYDAEFVALARLLGCRLVTLDGRLRRGADRLGFVVSPSEL